MIEIGVAKITDKKRINNRQTSLCVCVAPCSLCGHAHKVAFGGWVRLVCHGCGADIYRHYKTAYRMIEQAMADEPKIFDHLPTMGTATDVLQCLKWAVHALKGARQAYQFEIPEFDQALDRCIATIKEQEQ